jgi:hypothetical protein
MARQEGGQCSIGLVRARTAWLAGAAGAAIAVYHRMRRRRTAPVPAPAEDPRASELRQKLDESRAVAEEREEFESGEVTVDTDVAVDDRRQAVHERGKAAAEQMRRRPGE